MRAWLVLAAALVWSVPATSQSPNPRPPIYGVDYKSKRIVQERTVNDDYDQGKIRLVSYVLTPLKQASGEVVVALHGSTGGMAVWPGQPFNLGQFPVRFFLERGYTVVIPMRRGRAESTGHYVEECAYQAGKCSLADYRRMTGIALPDALTSTEVVVSELVLRKLKPPSGKILLWGGSRGGLLALHYAAVHPQEVRGVLAISPGWLSLADKWPKEENEARLALQKEILAKVGRAYGGPTMWVYAAKDSFYAEAFTRQLFATFRAAGGSGEYVYIADHALPDGHVPPSDLWKADADRFLQRLEQSSPVRQ